ncbi:hypothetical protein VTO73DRAFT_10295 [Trametes versicolor]
MEFVPLPHTSSARLTFALSVQIHCRLHARKPGSPGANVSGTSHITPKLAIAAAALIVLLVTSQRLLPIAFCLAMASDLMLTASLISILRRKRTGFSSTDNMIDVLMMYSVNTGLLNGIFDLLTTILDFSRPYSTVWALFGIAGAKLYAITLLAALHSRRAFRPNGSAELLRDSDALFGLSFSPVGASHSNATSSLSRSRPGRIQQPIQLHSIGTIDSLDVIDIKAPSPSLPPVVGMNPDGQYDTDKGTWQPECMESVTAGVPSAMEMALPTGHGPQRLSTTHLRALQEMTRAIL